MVRWTEGLFMQKKKKTCLLRIEIIVCGTRFVAGAKRGGEGEGEKFPFSLPPYPLPLSTPGTQASFVSFLCRHCSTMTWNFLMLCTVVHSMEDLNTRRSIILSLSLNLVTVLIIHAQENLELHFFSLFLWHFCYRHRSVSFNFLIFVRSIWSLVSFTNRLLLDVLAVSYWTIDVLWISITGVEILSACFNTY